MTIIRRLADAITERVVPRADAKAECAPKCWNAGSCPGGGTNQCCRTKGCVVMCVC
ncbi:hypothetical protein [Phytomonospora endophytica]|uniref:Uncharacterized protein n=1 Tax=Phytomonospora endophytica TaxID=714109 RepID=A0A841FJM5_9ACTN|nr:hypothetical protein [Phytomonospora endophytica]MBB6036386.1 hypothetical protein [Phytomonospora endophytica]GIG65707.1 hypothetical protein Pen01_20020 [Phytomonospora endophytica]